MTTRLLLAAALTIAMTTCVAADDAALFTGRWTGPWTNSLGENGNSNLRITEDADGKLQGTWDDVKVKGKRINKSTVELRGKNETRSYQLTCSLNDGKMKMKYIVTRLNMDGSYDGDATLSRVAAAGGTIKVKFTNKTDSTVTFFLNGGKGLETRLKAGASSGFTMVTDEGVTPTVKIYQTYGEARTFTVANGGVYSFREKDGGISNFFAE